MSLYHNPPPVVLILAVSKINNLVNVEENWQKRREEYDRHGDGEEVPWRAKKKKKRWNEGNRHEE